MTFFWYRNMHQQVFDLKKYVWVKKRIGAYLYLHEKLQLTYSFDVSSTTCLSLRTVGEKRRWDFDIQWHVSNLLAFTLCNCTDSFCRCRDFPVSCFFPQSFCHVSPQIKAAVHSRTNCVGMVEKDSAGVMCYQVRPSVQLWSPSHIKYSQ